MDWQIIAALVAPVLAVVVMWFALNLHRNRRR